VAFKKVNKAKSHWLHPSGSPLEVSRQVTTAGCSQNRHGESPVVKHGRADPGVRPGQEEGESRTKEPQESCGLRADCAIV